MLGCIYRIRSLQAQVETSYQRLHRTASRILPFPIGERMVPLSEPRRVPADVRRHPTRKAASLRACQNQPRCLERAARKHHAPGLHTDTPPSSVTRDDVQDLVHTRMPSSST